jgi:hypothetical protein
MLMRTIQATEPPNQSLQDPSSDEIIAEQAADHACELRRLSDLAFVFLNASNGDPTEAEELLDSAIDLLLEGGVLSTWRYRILLESIRESGAR